MGRRKASSTVAVMGRGLPRVRGGRLGGMGLGWIGLGGIGLGGIGLEWIGLGWIGLGGTGLGGIGLGGIGLGGVGSPLVERAREPRPRELGSEWVGDGAHLHVLFRVEERHTRLLRVRGRVESSPA